MIAGSGVGEKMGTLGREFEIGVGIELYKNIRVAYQSGTYSERLIQKTGASDDRSNFPWNFRPFASFQRASPA
jgi:hypothetical protein